MFSSQQIEHYHLYLNLRNLAQIEFNEKTHPVIGFYKPGKKERIDRLCKFGDLSNFATSRIKTKTGCYYYTVEAAWHAVKWPDYENEFEMQRTGQAAYDKKKELEKQKVPFRYPANYATVMLELLTLKFTQNENMKQLLLATGDAILIEYNECKSGLLWSNGSGTGRNLLGTLLMILRDYFSSNELKDIKESEWYKFIDIEPTDLKNPLSKQLKYIIQTGTAKLKECIKAHPEICKSDEERKIDKVNESCTQSDKIANAAKWFDVSVQEILKNMDLIKQYEKAQAEAEAEAEAKSQDKVKVVANTAKKADAESQGKVGANSTESENKLKVVANTAENQDKLDNFFKNKNKKKKKKNGQKKLNQTTTVKKSSEKDDWF